MNLIKVYILIIFTASLSNCKESYFRKSEENTNSNCDSLKPIISPSLKKDNLLRTEKKPNDLIEAIYILDKSLDDDTKQLIIEMGEDELYFTIGSEIRNEWVRNGTKHFRYQLFNTFKLKHIDYTSGFILNIYQYYLVDRDFQLLEAFDLDFNADSLQKFRDEILKIDSIISTPTGALL